MATKYRLTRPFTGPFTAQLVGLLFLLASSILAAPAVIPAPVRKLVFESGPFAAPATVLLPCPDDPVWKREILEKIRRSGGVRHYIEMMRSSPATMGMTACP